MEGDGVAFQPAARKDADSTRTASPGEEAGSGVRVMYKLLLRCCFDIPVETSWEFWEF